MLTGDMRRATVAAAPERARAKRSRSVGAQGGYGKTEDGKADDAADDASPAAPLRRGLELLRCFRPNDGALGNQELAQRTGLPNSSVSRLTYTLSRLGYLTYLEDIGKYRLGLAAFGLGRACLAGVRAREAALPSLREAARAIGVGVVSLGGRDGLKMTCLACAHGTGAVSLQLDVGSRLSLSRSAMGRAWLAGAAPDERAALLERIRADVDPRRWPRLEDGVLRAVDEVETQGFCLSVGEWAPDVSAVGVPLRPASGVGDPLLAVSYGGPSFMVSRDVLKNDVGPRLVALARAVSAAAG